MDFGDGTDPQPGFSYDDPMQLTYTYTLPGVFQAEILVQSCDAAQITDTLHLSIIGQVRLPLILMEQLDDFEVRHTGNWSGWLSDHFGGSL